MKDPFKHADKTFVVGENRIYIAKLPHHLAHKGLPSDVARTELFKLDSREGNLLTFKHGGGVSHSHLRQSAYQPQNGRRNLLH